MRYSLVHSSSLEFSPRGLWKGCPWAVLSLSSVQCVARKKPLATPSPECGSAEEACVNSAIGRITWHGLCLLPAGVSVVMTKDCDRGLPGDENCFICILAVKTKTGSLSYCLPSPPRKDPLLPPEWFRTCQELEMEETRPEAKNPQSLFHGNEKQVALITLDTKYLLPLKANPTLAGIASPPPRHPTPLYCGLSIRLISLIWQILITLIRAVLNRPD